MALRTEEVYDIMIAEKNTMANLSVLQPNIDSAQTLLTDLKSTSKVARWRLIFWCVAVAGRAMSVMCDMAIVLLERIAARSTYGTLPWYVRIAKEFQNGDALVRINDEWKYSPVIEANQIVKLAAAKEGIGVVNLKVAKIIGGVTQKLATPEYNNFAAYIKKRKPAGINVNVISDDPDDLKIYIDVAKDPLVMTDAGELILSPGVFPVEDRVNEYLKNLDFDGGFEIMRLTDFIQKSEPEGVETVYVTDAQARYGANPFVSFSKRYYPNAGYLKIHAGTPLSATITYTDNV